MTDWDRECTEWSVKNGLDWIALSFVRNGKDIEELKAFITKCDGSDPAKEKVNRLRTVAKVEVPQAIKEIDSICAAAVAIMVARGDLGVEMDLEQVPVLQKQIMAAAHAHGKSIIVATQMLESMISAASPTRAEVSDVANAVLDGADAVMLSAETSVGQFPVETVGYMARTALSAEAFTAHLGSTRKAQGDVALTTRYRTGALALGVQAAARSINAKRIVVWTEFGGGARYLSQLRLTVPVTAFSCNQQALRQIGMLYGVRPVKIERPEGARDFIAKIDAYLLGRGFVEKGDPVIVVFGTPFGVAGAGSTNTMHIHYAGDSTGVER
jgi:pyruvate kinase